MEKLVYKEEMEMKKLIILLALLFLPSLAWGQLRADVNEKEISYPAEVSTVESKIGYVYEALDKLRLAFNAKGAEYRAGTITQKQYTDWKETVYYPRERALLSDMNNIKASMQSARVYNVNLETTFKDKANAEEVITIK